MIKIYTDGSSIGNPGPGGRAILVLHDDKKNLGGNAGTLLETDRTGTVSHSDVIDENQLSELETIQPIGRGHLVGMPKQMSMPQSLFLTDDAGGLHTLENAVQKTHTSVGKAVSIAGKENYTTNNRMELTAVISALLYIQQEGLFDKHVILYMDSTYVHDGLDRYLDQRIARGRRLANKKPVQNIDLRKQLSNLKDSIEAAMLISGGTLQREWVKAHHTDRYNNLVDKLAREQAEG